MRSALIAGIFILFSLPVPAQQAESPAAPPFQAKRLPPGKANANTGDPESLELSNHSDSVPQSNAGSVSAPASVATPPPGFKPKTDVSLNKTAQEAVQMSEKWMAEHNQPVVSQDGRVLYSYGAGLPSIVCAPLRVCIIELQSGERLVGEPHIGDSVRWNISPAMFGHGDSATTIIVLKPQNPGLDTNLLVTTDRRAYYLRLLSKPEDYVARVAFAYPEEENNHAKWQEQLAKQKRTGTQEHRHQTIR